MLEFDIRSRPGGAGGFELAAHCRLPGSGVTALFGPSGAGKTTLLRALAGLDDGVTGTIQFDGECWLDARTRLPAHRRRVGYVPQRAGLFPHLDVAGNLDYARRRAAGPSALAHDDVVGMLDLRALLHRDTASLSGGEAQRVAIGRALLSAPRLMLLDEPLAALDAARKAEILPFLDAVVEASSLPVIYVSHAIDEVVRLADRVVTMADGRVAGSGTVLEIFGLHATGVADAGPGAVIEAVVSGYDREWQLATLDVEGRPLHLPLTATAPGRRVRLRVAASDVALASEAPTATSVLNCIPAVVVDIAPDPDGPMALVTLEVGPQRLLSRVTRRSLAVLGIAPGDRTHALIKSAALIRGG